MSPTRWGPKSPVIGEKSAFIGEISPFIGEISPFIGEKSAFIGEISPFIGVKMKKNLVSHLFSAIFFGIINPIYNDRGSRARLEGDHTSGQVSSRPHTTDGTPQMVVV